MNSCKPYSSGLVWRSQADAWFVSGMVVKGLPLFTLSEPVVHEFNQP